MNPHWLLFFCQTCPVLDKRELFFTFYIVAGKILYLVGLAITHILQFLHFTTKFMIIYKHIDRVYGIRANVNHCKANLVLFTERQLLCPNLFSVPFKEIIDLQVA